MTREEQGDDKSDREVLREPDIGIAFARMSERSGLDGRGERSGRVRFSSKHPPVAVVETRVGLHTEMTWIRSGRKMRERGPLYIPMRIGGDRKNMVRWMIAGSAERLYEQVVEDVVRSAKKNVEQRRCRQRETKTCLRGFYYMRFFRGSKLVHCSVLKKINLTAWEALSRRALNSKLDEVGSKTQRDREKLQRKNEELEKELEAAQKTTARLKETVRENRTSQDTKRKVVERQHGSGSMWSPTSNGGSEVESPAHRMGNGMCAKWFER